MFDYTNESKHVVKGGPSSRRVIDFQILKIAGPYRTIRVRLVRITTTRQKYTMQGILEK
jgi:hypothetical protein